MCTLSALRKDVDSVSNSTLKELIHDLAVYVVPIVSVTRWRVALNNPCLHFYPGFNNPCTSILDSSLRSEDPLFVTLPGDQH